MSTQPYGALQKHAAVGVVDFQIITLLTSGLENKDISKILNIPLSTIQRRTRNIIQNKLVEGSLQPNYKLLGINRGLFHVYLGNGEMKEVANELVKIDGILSAAIHVGNSDVTGDFVYENSEQLMDTFGKIKHLKGVDHVVWSQEVYNIPAKPEHITKSFEKFKVHNNINKLAK